MVARGEFFRNYHLPVFSTELNGSQSEEINATDKSQAENRPVPMQQAEIRWKKVSAIMFVVLSVRGKDNSHSPLTVSVR